MVTLVFFFFCSLIYGPPNSKENIAFWDRISQLGSSFIGLWLILGDLNAIIGALEKLEGSPNGTSSSTAFLSTTIDSLGHIDLGYLGYKYIWDNWLHECANIQECLDRGLSIAAWL